MSDDFSRRGREFSARKLSNPALLLCSASLHQSFCGLYSTSEEGDFNGPSPFLNIHELAH